MRALSRNRWDSGRSGLVEIDSQWITCLPGRIDRSPGCLMVCFMGILLHGAEEGDDVIRQRASVSSSVYLFHMTSGDDDSRW